MTQEQSMRESIAKDATIHKGSEEQPAQMVMNIKDEGMVVIYDTKSGEPIKVLKYLLKDLIKAKHDDGSLRFTTVDPKIPLKRGTLKCLLHQAGENREHYNELGLPVCKKSNLTAPYMVEQHMQKRHPSAWAIIKKEKEDREKEEDKEFQRFIVKELVKATKK